MYGSGPEWPSETRVLSHVKGTEDKGVRLRTGMVPGDAPAKGSLAGIDYTS